MNSYILHLETSTVVCSACLSNNGDLLAIRESNEGNVHSTMLTVYIDECLKEAGIKMRDLSAISVSAGPGSYTGLRVAFAAAKGIGHALEIPLICIPTLEALAFSFFQLNSEFNLYIPMLDARRNEVYTVSYDSDMNVVDELRALILDEGVFDGHHQGIAFFGNGAFKMKSQLKQGDEIFDWETSAQHQIKLAYKKWLDKTFDDIAYATPIYLKPPNITIPKPLL